MSLFRCRRCLYPNLKPDLHFDESGLCSACIAFDRRKTINWVERARQFMELVNANRGKSHDVIVACSGGKDSTAQIVRCLGLGLRPLAVTASTDHLSALGRRNLDNIASLCDLVEVTPHRPTRRKISKFALEEVGDISWCEHHLIWSIPARESIARSIPIVLYGENPQSEYGAGPPGSELRTRLDKSWVHEFGGLLGLRVSDACEILDIEERQLEIYRYPENAESVQALFMGAFFEWDGYENFLIAERNGFEQFDEDHVEGSLYGYENLDNCETGIHDRIRFLKFGYGRAIDIASSHIRRGRLTRDQAIELVRGRDGAYPLTYLGVHIDQILSPLGMQRRQFDAICERFTNHKVVEWASSSASFQCFSGQTMDALKESNSIRRVA